LPWLFGLQDRRNVDTRRASLSEVSAIYLGMIVTDHGTASSASPEWAVLCSTRLPSMQIREGNSKVKPIWLRGTPATVPILTMLLESGGA